MTERFLKCLKKPLRREKKAMRYKIIDLCAGIGGIRKGFELTEKFQNVLSAEIDKYACMTYEHVYGDNPFNDITDESFKRKVEKTQYDVLLAGFPCQAFSRAGKKMGFMDKTRGTLFFDIADIIKRTKPKAFLLENVDNLLRHDKGSTFLTIINTLVRELGYKIIGIEEDSEGNFEITPSSFIRNSKNFGVPQNRPRVYIMGFNKEFYGKHSCLKGMELPFSREAAPIYNDLNDVLDKDVAPRYWLSSGYLETLKIHRERHQNKGNGFGYIVLNTADVEKPISNALLATGGSGKERNLVFQKNREIEGRMVGQKHTPINNEGIRVMTPREWGKLQGFIGYGFIRNRKDYFEFPKEVAVTQQYKQFGNAVTIPVIEEMASFMYKCFRLMSKGGNSRNVCDRK